MTDLIDFLKAQLDEAKAGAWAIHDVTKCDALLYEADMADAAARTPDCDCGYPARVLAGVEAKRRILALYEELYEPALYEAIQHLAMPHADQPDYDQAWRV